MLQPWHRTGIFEALASRGWGAPSASESDSYEVGEKYTLRRGGEVLTLWFVADLGTGYSGDRSIEELVARHYLTGCVHRLWLHSRSGSKWKRDLYEWTASLARCEEAHATPLISPAERYEVGGRTVLVYFTPEFSGLFRLAELPDSPFVLLFAGDTSTQSTPDCLHFASYFLQAGAVYICAWGEDADRVESCFDEEHVAAAIDGGSTLATVMTTRHDGETLRESVWFAAHLARPDVEHAGDCTYLVIAVLGEHGWYSEICNLLAAGAPPPRE